MLEEFGTLLAELSHGVSGWLNPRRDVQAGSVLRSWSAIVLNADAGEKGCFLTTLPAGACVRVERVSEGDAPMCWVIPVDVAVRRALIPANLRHSVSSYMIELPHADRCEHFDSERQKP